MYYIKPAKGFLTSLFSNSRKNPVLGIVRPHQGIDFGNDSDNTIVASARGKVRIADNAGKSGFGKYIIITHPNGQETVYAHLSSLTVGVGKTIAQGQKIGMKGTTGNSTGIHLHFEISKGRWTNNFSNKIDPLLQFIDPVTKDIQEMLNKLGHKLTADGLYGDSTISAVSKYQKEHRLACDGVCGRSTFAHMEDTVKSKLVAVDKPVTSKPNIKGDDELEFSSPTLQKETETSITSKARREIIVNTAVEGGANKSWLDKLKNNTITDGDIFGLAIKYIVDTNK